MHASACRTTPGARPSVALYDQLGSGDSTLVREKPAHAFTPELFVAELDNLLLHLGITQDFHLLRQSWGVTIAVEYIAAHHPTGLKYLVLTSGPASYPRWQEALAGLRALWPREFQDTLGRHERDDTADAPEYQDRFMQFYRKHIFNLEVWPPETLKSMVQMREDPMVYRAT
jgi:L-proline amide hydrolase